MSASTSKFEREIMRDAEGTGIRYSPAVLEEVRRLAVDGLNAFSHGGVEIGGVLYGLREADTISVLSFAELPCEHALGPRFVLSENDRRAMGELMQPPAGLETVGWFRSHTRSGMELDANDHETFRCHFAETESVALIVQPTRLGTATAAFFTRRLSGELLPHAPPLIEVELPKRGAGQPDAPPDAAAAEAEPAVPRQSPARSASESNHRPPASRKPQLIRHARKPRHAWAWAICAIAILGALAGLRYRLPDSDPRPADRAAAGGLELQVVPTAPGQVLIQWNRGSNVILESTSGELQIQDGDLITTLPLDATRIRSSTVTYGLRNRRISVRLRVDTASQGAAPAEDVVEFDRGPEPLAVQAEITGSDPASGWAERVAPAPPREVKNPKEQNRKEQARKERNRKEQARNLKKQVEARTAKTPVARQREPVRLATLTPPPGTAAVVNAAALPPAPAINSGPPQPAAIPNLPSLLRGRTLSPPPAVTPSYSGANSGRLIWTGVLGRRGVVEIDGSRVSVGSVIGTLPGVPVAMRVSPADFSRDGLIVYTADRARAGAREAPSKSNGWNSLHFEFDEARARELVVIEAPNRDNAFTRLVLRNEGRGYSVVLVDWNVR